jgi:CheY-like chemotaxis protein
MANASGGFLPPAPMNIGHLANAQIPQMANAFAGFLHYTVTRSTSPTTLRGEMNMRILIADPQPKVRFALRVLLERQPGLEVVGEAGDAEGLLSQTEVACPDAVLLGWELSGIPVEQVMSALRKACPELVVIALSGRLEAQRAAAALGADAFVSKSSPPEQLLAAIAACECESKEGPQPEGNSKKRTIPLPEA